MSRIAKKFCATREQAVIEVPSEESGSIARTDETGDATFAAAAAMYTAWHDVAYMSRRTPYD